MREWRFTVHSATMATGRPCTIRQAMIESRANSKIRLVESVRQGKDRRLALVEGERGVVEAARADLTFNALLATPECAETLGQEAIKGVPRALATDPRLLASLSDLDAPRDAIGVVELPRRQADTIDGIDAAELVVYADRVQDPVNLGALARVCSAVGASALLTAPGCAHPNHHRALRASAWSLLTFPVYTDCAWSRMLDLTAGANRVALDGHATTSIYDYQLVSPAVVVIGGEMGIDPQHLLQIDNAVIPMPGDVQSLNLAVAAGIALFEWIRRFD